MKIFYDTEFHEDGTVIELISIGMVREDGEEYYAISSEFAWDRAQQHPWLPKNVLAHLPTTADGWLDLSHPDVKTRARIRQDLLKFCAAPNLELWAYFSAYDHVALAQLFGTMMDFPSGWPQRTRDLAQRIDEFQAWGFMPAPAVDSTLHNALDDARFVKSCYEFLDSLET